jgi:hypothetical protein
MPLPYLKMVFDKYHDEDLYVCNIKMDLREAV